MLWGFVHIAQLCKRAAEAEAKLKRLYDAIENGVRQARRRMRTENGGYRRDHLRALAQRVEVDAKEVRIMGSKSELLRTLVAASSAKTVGFGMPFTLPERGVTFHTGDMGDTFGPLRESRGAVEGVSRHGRAGEVHRTASGRRTNVGAVRGVLDLA
jgi:hypothetical protein